MHRWAGSGESYVGSWKDNKRHGRGFMKFASGARYDGQFAANAVEGVGKLHYANGEHYVGCFKASRRHGEYSDEIMYCLDAA